MHKLCIACIASLPSSPRLPHPTLPLLQTAIFSEPVTRMYGAALGTSAAQTFAVAASDFSRVRLHCIHC